MGGEGLIPVVHPPHSSHHHQRPIIGMTANNHSSTAAANNSINATPTVDATTANSSTTDDRTSTACAPTPQQLLSSKSTTTTPAEETYLSLIQQYLSLLLIDNATFLAEQCIAEFPTSLSAIYLLAMCYYRTNYYKRARWVLEHYAPSIVVVVVGGTGAAAAAAGGVPSTNSTSSTTTTTTNSNNSSIRNSMQYLAAQCSYELQDYHRAEEVLLKDARILYRQVQTQAQYMARQQQQQQVQVQQVPSQPAVYHSMDDWILQTTPCPIPNGAAGLALLGKICRQSNRKQRAILYYKMSLQLDPFLWISQQALAELGEEHFHPYNINNYHNYNDENNHIHHHHNTTTTTRQEQQQQYHPETYQDNMNPMTDFVHNTMSTNTNTTTTNLFGATVKVSSPFYLPNNNNKNNMTSNTTGMMMTPTMNRPNHHYVQQFTIPTTTISASTTMAIGQQQQQQHQQEQYNMMSNRFHNNNNNNNDMSAAFETPGLTPILINNNNASFLPMDMMETPRAGVGVVASSMIGTISSNTPMITTTAAAAIQRQHSSPAPFHLPLPRPNDNLHVLRRARQVASRHYYPPSPETPTPSTYTTSNRFTSAVGAAGAAATTTPTTSSLTKSMRYLRGLSGSTSSAVSGIGPISLDRSTSNSSYQQQQQYPYYSTTSTTSATATVSAAATTPGPPSRQSIKLGTENQSYNQGISTSSFIGQTAGGHDSGNGSRIDSLTIDVDHNKKLSYSTSTTKAAAAASARSNGRSWNSSSSTTNNNSGVDYPMKHEQEHESQHQQQQQSKGSTTDPYHHSQTNHHHNDEMIVVQGILHTLYISGLIYQQVCQYQCRKALETISSLPMNQQRTSWTLHQQGRAYLELSDFTSAQRSLEYMRRRDPGRMDGLELLSTVYWQLKKEIELASLAQHVMDWDKLSPQAWCVVGNCFSLQKDHESALLFFHRSLQLDCNFTYTHTLSGYEYMANEDFEKGTTCFRQALRTNDRHYNAWYGLGAIYHRQEKYDLAEYHFERACLLHTGSSVLRCNLGIAQYANGKAYQALETLSEALLLDPRNPQARFQRATIYSTLHRPHEALQELEKVRDAAPREATVYFAMGKVLKRLGRPEEAMKCFLIAMDLDPKESQMIKSAMDKLDEPDLDEEHMGAF